MVIWVAIALGGALGSMARHAINQLVAGFIGRLPLGTAIVNVAGCFVIGVLAGLLATSRLGMGPSSRAFVFVGLLGGFTTFSTFGLDTFVLSRSSIVLAGWNVAIHVAGGLMAVWAGYHLAVLQR
jgi:CrcB protein